MNFSPIVATRRKKSPQGVFRYGGGRWQRGVQNLSIALQLFSCPLVFYEVCLCVLLLTLEFKMSQVYIFLKGRRILWW